MMEEVQLLCEYDCISIVSQIVTFFSNQLNGAYRQLRCAHTFSTTMSPDPILISLAVSVILPFKIKRCVFIIQRIYQGILLAK